jgi:hypothetical protein
MVAVGSHWLALQCAMFTPTYSKVLNKGQADNTPRCSNKPSTSPLLHQNNSMVVLHVDKVD